MRASAVWFAGPRQVVLRQEAIPSPGPSEVRVRTLCSAISHGTEMLVYRGEVSPALALDLPTLRGSYGFPIKYGYACVGRVVEAGEAARRCRVGDLVFVHHPHQTEFVVPDAQAVPLPPALSPEAGVFLANLETALNVLLDAAPRLGEQLIIFGQGVVGLLLTRLARRMGPALIVTVDPLSLRRSLSLVAGADLAITPEEAVQVALEQTDGLGMDLALEASGNGAALQQAIECTAIQGTVVVCSWYGRKPVTLDLGGAFHRRRLRLVSSQVSTIDPLLQPRWSPARRLALALTLLPALRPEALITHRFRWEEAAAAYTLVDRHPEETVQVILTYGDDDV